MSSEIKSLKKVAPSGKVTISGRDEALTNIAAFYDDDTGTIELPPHQNKIRERWETIHGLLLKGKSEAKICTTIATMYDVSESSVRRDIQAVEQLFGSRKLSFEIRRQRAVELSLETYRMARKEKDLKGMNAAIANLVKADGLDKEPVDLPFDKLEPHIFIIVLDPAMERKLDTAFPIVHGRITLNDFTADAETAEYETATNDTQNG